MKTTSYRYNNSGELVEKIIDSGYLDLYFHYDSQSKQIETDNPCLGSGFFTFKGEYPDEFSETFDGNGRVTKAIHRMEEEFTRTIINLYTYDNQRRISVFENGDIRRDTYSYNSDGSFTVVRKSGGYYASVVTETYNTKGLITYSEEKSDDGSIIKIYDYDYDDNLKSVTTMDNTFGDFYTDICEYTYDIYGRITSESSSYWGNTVYYQYEYDNDGNVTTKICDYGDYINRITYKYQKIN